MSSLFHRWFATKTDSEMVSRILTIGIFASIACISTAQLTGNVTLIEGFESKVLQRKTRVWVYQPPASFKGPFPVLYMLDGQNVFDGNTAFIKGKEWRADENAEALINARLVAPIIIVAVANGEVKRADEYTPVKQGNYGGGKADDYIKFLQTELMPWVEKTYHIKKGASNTGLAGSSLGGLFTAYAGFLHPTLFGRLGIVSPSVWWGDRYIVKNAKKTKARIWLDIGAKEGPQAVADTRAFNDKLVELGWKPGKDLAYYEIADGEHNETSWANRFGEMLMFLFPARK